jgi:hypothetical protein
MMDEADDGGAWKTAPENFSLRDVTPLLRW